MSIITSLGRNLRSISLAGCVKVLRAPFYPTHVHSSLAFAGPTAHASLASGVQVSEQAVEKLVAECPNLENVSLSGCDRITDASLERLSSLTKLQQLVRTPFSCTTRSGLTMNLSLLLLGWQDISWCRQLTNVEPLSACRHLSVLYGTASAPFPRAHNGGRKNTDARRAWRMQQSRRLLERERETVHGALLQRASHRPFHVCTPHLFPAQRHVVHSRVRFCALCRVSCSDECGGIRRKHLSWCAQNQRFAALRSLTLSGTIASLAPHALI